MKPLSFYTQASQAINDIFFRWFTESDHEFQDLLNEPEMTAPLYEGVIQELQAIGFLEEFGNFDSDAMARCEQYFMRKVESLTPIDDEDVKYVTLIPFEMAMSKASKVKENMYLIGGVQYSYSFLETFCGRTYEVTDVDVSDDEKPFQIVSWEWVGYTLIQEKIRNL